MLILTAADSVEQRVEGLDLGADDYMAKPFSLQELEARVRPSPGAAWARPRTSSRHGPLSFDATGRVAYINEQMIELSAREIGLLEVLLQRAGRLVSKDQLVERLCEWGDEVSNNAIEVYVHRLRKKIEQGTHRASPPCAAWLLPGADRRLGEQTLPRAAERRRPTVADPAQRNFADGPLARTTLALRRDPQLDARCRCWCCGR